MDDNVKYVGDGISTIGALQIAFIVLKLCGVIKWSWVWVLCPLWLSFLFLLVVLLLFLSFVLFMKYFGGRL